MCSSTGGRCRCRGWRRCLAGTVPTTAATISAEPERCARQPTPTPAHAAGVAVAPWSSTAPAFAGTPATSGTATRHRRWPQRRVAATGRPVRLRATVAVEGLRLRGSGDGGRINMRVFGCRFICRKPRTFPSVPPEHPRGGNTWSGACRRRVNLLVRAAKSACRWHPLQTVTF